MMKRLGWLGGMLIAACSGGGGGGCSTPSGSETASAPAPSCEPQQRVCREANVFVCDDAGVGWSLLDTCANGCTGGECEAPTCVADCSGRACGDDGCGASCGSCTGAQETCVEGVCQCVAACADQQCGDDGCGGTCGTCDPVSSYCDAQLRCQACESPVCGVCDELDLSQVVAYAGQIGGDHAINQLRAEVFQWPITTELEVDLSGASPCFSLHHFDGESWGTTWNGYSEGAAMIACWHSVAQGGVVCESYEWYTPDWNICRSVDWPVDRPVAQVFVSAVDEKRTAIRYFGSWPYNNVSPDFNSSDVGTQLVQRPCL